MNLHEWDGTGMIRLKGLWLNPAPRSRERRLHARVVARGKQRFVWQVLRLGRPLNKRSGGVLLESTRGAPFTVTVRA